MNARWHEAALWLQRLDQNEVSDEELRAWLDWCARSPDNDQVFEEMQDLFLALREAPAAEKEALRRLAQPDRSRYMRRAWGLAASVLAVLIGGTFWWLATAKPPEYTTGRGEHRTVSLPDGSRVVLGGDSSVALNYSEARRDLNLKRGEAYFEVKKDATRPFVVEAGAVQVTAVGTAFDVKHAGEHVTVAVAQGVVRVSEGTTPDFRLKAGEKSDVAAVFVEAGLPPVVKRVNPETIDSWQQGQLQFSGEPLGAVVESVNRYARRQIVKVEPEVAAWSYTGTVQRDRADEWIDNLPQIFPVKKVDLPDGNVVLVKRSD
jgi:transmembrane sensor